MSEKKSIETNAQLIELLNNSVTRAINIAKQSNKQARKRNRIAKRQLRQSILNYEQLERQYLIEKSALQPTFKLFVTEFLMFEPDFLNDPEVASEAVYLANLGVEIEQRVLRFRLRVKGDAEYRRPSLVIQRLGQVGDDETTYSMNELLYFIPLADIGTDDNVDSFLAYFVYRDKTTLPVVHKYQIAQRQDSTLRRWEVTHLDTAYAGSHKNISALKTSTGCEALFLAR